jgi:hypothetical protein
MNRNLTSIILIILAVGLYFTVTQGLLDGAQEIRKVNAQYTTALTHAAQLMEARDNLLKQFSAISDADRARLAKMIPSTVDNIRLVIDLNNLAQRHGFSLIGAKAALTSDTSKTSAAQSSTFSPIVGSGSSVLTAASIAAPTLDTVTVSFGATAGYDQFIEFLKSVEADLRIMDLTHLSIVPGGTGGYTFQVQFQTYWLRQ